MNDEESVRNVDLILKIHEEYQNHRDNRRFQRRFHSKDLLDMLQFYKIK